MILLFAIVVFGGLFAFLSRPTTSEDISIVEPSPSLPSGDRQNEEVREEPTALTFPSPSRPVRFVRVLLPQRMADQLESASGSFEDERLDLQTEKVILEKIIDDEQIRDFPGFLQKASDEADVLMMTFRPASIKDQGELFCPINVDGRLHLSEAIAKTMLVDQQHRGVPISFSAPLVFLRDAPNRSGEPWMWSDILQTSKSHRVVLASSDIAAWMVLGLMEERSDSAFNRELSDIRLDQEPYRSVITDMAEALSAGRISIGPEHFADASLIVSYLDRRISYQPFQRVELLDFSKRTTGMLVMIHAFVLLPPCQADREAINVFMEKAVEIPSFVDSAAPPPYSALPTSSTAREAWAKQFNVSPYVVQAYDRLLRAGSFNPGNDVPDEFVALAFQFIRLAQASSNLDEEEIIQQLNRYWDELIRFEPLD